jgi:glycosyltransferase involved in cell wall biosynthesis
VPDPCYRYDGSLERAAVVVNEPVRRGRVTGTDLLPLLAGEMPLDLFGIGTEPLGGCDLPQAAMHGAIARRRAYVHPYRWTSLGLALIEAMLLGLPVVCLATTEAAEVVPRSAGVVSNDIRRLQAGVRDLRRDPDRARAAGLEGRRVALERFSLARFLSDWDDLLARVAP